MTLRALAIAFATFGLLVLMVAGVFWAMRDDEVSRDMAGIGVTVLVLGLVLNAVRLWA